MPQTCEWKILNMIRTTSNGGVHSIDYECIVKDDDNPECMSFYGGKLLCSPDPSADGFINYEDLSETTVLGWVYNSLIEGDETAEEAKVRIEADRKAKVTAMVARKNSDTEGMPWPTDNPDAFAAAVEANSD